MILILARFFQYAAVCALFGGGTFALWLRGRAGQSPRPAMWPWIGLLILSSLAGLWGTTAAMADAPPTIAMLLLVLRDTGIGHIWLLRFGLMLVLALVAWSKSLPKTAVLLSGLLLISLAWAGHGAMNEGAAGVLHLAADAAHLLGAGLWLGSLPMLLLLLRGDPIRAQTAFAGFSRLGTTAVALIAVGGLVNSWFLVGFSHIRGLLATPYGRLLLAKLMLFAIMLGLASLNRWVLTPALRRDGPRHLRLAVGIELGCGLLVLAAVAWMGTLVPTVEAN